MQLRKAIELNEGVRVDVLCTPRFYSVARRKGIDVTSKKGMNPQELQATYLDILYCAAVNAWEVDAMDDPDMGEFPYKYGEFHEMVSAWAIANPKQYLAFVNFLLEAMTGRSLKEIIADEKKKMRTADR